MSRIAFIGGGNMARCLIGGLIRTGTPPADIAVSEPNEALRSGLERDFGVRVHSDNAAAAAQADVVLLAVKPQVLRAVCEGLAPVVQANRALIISIAAGIQLAQLQRWLGTGLAIARCMPNTPALIGAGATGMYANAATTPAQRERTEGILGTAGLTVWLEREEWVDVVTALSGSGPAYFFLLAEALEDAAVEQGLPRDTARLLAAQTALGAGRMLREDGAPPGTLRERVTSPGGTTQAALESFAASGLRETVARAVDAATKRGRELAAKSED